MVPVKCDHIKRLITLTSDNIKRLSLYPLKFAFLYLFVEITYFFKLPIKILHKYATEFEDEGH